MAAALLALDCGLYRPGAPVDVLVCRATMDSLGIAQRALTTTPARPFLAVVTDLARIPPGSPFPRPIRARLRMTEGATAGVFLIPFVPSWREVDNPWLRAQAVLTQLPSGATREFHDAIVALVTRLAHDDGWRRTNASTRHHHVPIPVRPGGTP